MSRPGDWWCVANHWDGTPVSAPVGGRGRALPAPTRSAWPDSRSRRFQQGRQRTCRCSGRHGRHQYREWSCAPVADTVRRDRPAVQLDQVLRDRQPQPEPEARASSTSPPGGTARTRAAGTRRRSPGPCPARRCSDLAVARSTVDSTRPPGVGELDRVVQQVPQDLLQPLRRRPSTCTGGVPTVATELNAPWLGGRLQALYRALERRAHVHDRRRRAAGCPRSAGSCRAGRRSASPAAARCGGSAPAPSRDRGPACRSRRICEPAQDRVHRRAQLVAERRQELVLQPALLLGLARAARSLASSRSRSCAASARRSRRG